MQPLFPRYVHVQGPASLRPASQKRAAAPWQAVLELENQLKCRKLHRSGFRLDSVFWHVEAQSSSCCILGTTGLGTLSQPALRMSCYIGGLRYHYFTQDSFTARAEPQPDTQLPTLCNSPKFHLNPGPIQNLQQMVNTEPRGACFRMFKLHAVWLQATSTCLSWVL